MTMKPFEIQSTALSIGGVKLETSATGTMVVPGITRAASSVAIEVEDTQDQTVTWTGNPVVIDGYSYALYVTGEVDGLVGFVPATYAIDELDDDGYIDDISVVTGGANYTGEAVTFSQTMWAAPEGTPMDSSSNGQWTEIPFRVRCGPGEVESEFGGGGGSGNQLVSNNDGNTFALMDEGDVVFDGEGPGGVDRGLVWKFGENLGGVNSQVRQDEGGLTVRAWTEVGEGTYSASVNIVTNQDAAEKTWEFDGDGGLTFPDGTTQTTAYTGQSSGGSTISKFVMVNEDGGVYGSDDGTNWNGPFNTGLTRIDKVAVGPDMIVYIGNSGGQYLDLYYTTAWDVTPTLVGEIAPPEWRQVRYFAGINKFVAVGNLVGVPTYKHSSDGINWTTVSLDNAWASGLNGGDGYGSASFTDIAVNNTGGFILTTGNTTLGSFYTTSLTTNSTIGIGEWLNDGMDFQEVVYSNGDFSGWFAFGNGNTGADDGWWLNGSSDPSGGSFSNSWGISDISQEFADEINYNPGWSEITIGRKTGASLDTIMIGSEDGQILYWPTEPAGPYVSIPKPYTSPIADIVRGTTTTILLNGGQDPANDGEKITISGVTSVDASEPGTSEQSYNGTFYIKNNGGNFELYTDTGLTSPWDTTSYWPVNTDTGTLTWSHGQYIDALNFAGGKFYVGNDDEEVFVSEDGGETWTQVAELNPGGGENGDGTGTQYMNDIDGYVGEAVNYQLVNGSKTFTLNSDGTITPPTLTVDLHNGGVQQAQVLQFGDTQQVIITGPTPAPGDNAERLIIQGQNGGSGEGGDVYFWAGDADNNGGDIKIYAGDADSGTSGDSGGYVNIEGGSGYTNGGDVTITGGNSTVNGGDVRIEGGGGSTPGKVQIQSLYSQWQFKPDGTLQLPTGGDIVDSNGTTVLGGGGTSTNGFDVLTDGTKQATVTEQEGIANNSSELISGIPEFLSTAARSPNRQTLDTHYGFDGTGMWFTGDNQRYYDGAPSPAYPVFTSNSFPSNAKAVVTFIFTLTDGNEDPGICFYPANGVPYWDWDPHPSRIAVMMDQLVPAIYGLTSVIEGPNVSPGVSYRGQVIYEPVKNRTTFNVISLDTGRVVSSVWLDGRLPEGEAYRIGFDADWDEANPGDKSYFSDLTIVVGDDNLEVKTDFTLTGKIKLPSSVKGQINLNGPWQNGDDDIFYQAVTTHNGYAYLVGSDEWQQNDQIQLYKYSLTTGELAWKKVLFAGQDALFNFSWADNAYALDNINNSGYGYQVGEELYIEGWTFGGGNGDNGLTIQVTGVTESGAITDVTLSGTAPSGSGNITDVNPTNNQNRGNPTGISYDAVNNQLLVLFELWTGQGNNNDSNWTRAVVLRVSPDTGAVIFSSTLKDEGDVSPWAIDVSSDGSPVVVGQKYNEYRTFGTLTMSATGNGYFDILKSNLDEEYYPGTTSPGVYSYDFWIEGSGIANKENVDGVNEYTAITGSVIQGSGAEFTIATNNGTFYSVDSVSNGGTNYLVGHKIKVLGSAVGGSTPTYDLILTVTGVDAGAITGVSVTSGTPDPLAAGPYTGVVGTNYNTGSGADFNFTYDMAGSLTNYGIYSQVGENYVVGDKIVIPGTTFAGGTSPDNDITITVNAAGVTGDLQNPITVGGGFPTNAIRVRVDGVDFTTPGGEWTMKQNLNGEAFVWTADWNKCIGGATNDWFGSVTYSNDGQSHIYAVGSGRYDVNYDQSLVVKFDAPTGDILWSKTINSFETDSEATGVAPMNFSTDIIVTGSEYHIAENRKMTYVARISITGDIIWKRFYDDNWNNWADYSDVQVDSNDNIYISMTYNDNHGYWNNAFNVFKLNQDGIVIWTRAVNSYGSSSYLGNFDGIGWSSFDETTQQLVVAGYTNSFDDNYRCGLWVGFPADGFTFIGGEGSFAQQGPWRFGNGGKYLGYTESTTSAAFTPTPLASNIDTVNNAKAWRTQEPADRFPQWLTTMVDETNGGIVFGDGSKQTFATNIIPQIRAYNDYYLRPTDSGKHIYYGPNTNSGTIYIPYWDSVKLPVGFTFTIVNRCGSDVYVQVQNGNQQGRIYGAGMDGSSTQWGIPDSGSGSMVTLMKVEEGFDSNGVYQGDVWMISGPGDIYSN